MSRIFKSAAASLIVIIILLALHYIGWLKPVENIFFRTISPVQRVFYTSSLSVKGFYDNWLARRDLLAENKKLQSELESNLIDVAEFNLLKSENELLKQELKFVQSSSAIFVSAKIITGVSDPLSKSVVIDRGSNDGVTEGLAVLAGEGVIIGKIIEVYPDFSKVLLLTDNKSILAATVQNIDQTAGLVEGQFGLSLMMTNIPQDQEINEGDLVVTSGLEGSIPQGLLVAKVESINIVESEIFKTAILQPLVSFNSLSYVLVVIP